MVEVPDLNLENALREALELPASAPLTQQKMRELTGFAAEAAQVENITGLEYAINLKHLFLRDNPIKDLSPLANLRQLTHLNLTGVPIEDLTFLSNLTQLKVLHLGYCQMIRDITPLLNLTQLNLLTLSGNQIVNISPLANLIMLEELHIKSNRIIDISPLANLTRLKRLYIEHNLITDFSPLAGLSLIELTYDEVCLLPDPPIQDRIENRSFPSIFQGWDDGTRLSPLSREDFISYHDLYWHHIPFLHGFTPTLQGYLQLAGNIEHAIAIREEFLARNSNMLFLVEIRIRNASLSRYPEDWFGWVRDEAGTPVLGSSRLHSYLIDLRLPEVQDVIVQQAVAVSKCGLYDGIMFDWWWDAPFPLASFNADGSVRDLEWIEEDILLSIIQRIRRAVPDDFLILCNTNWRKIASSAPYMNGSFMETGYDEDGYTRLRIAEIEDSLLWYEETVREPQINCLRGHGIPTEPPDSPTNRRWMRLFTTMSLTLSDGYVVYTTGRWYQEHIWYPFWDADLGQPIGPTAQRYGDIEGLYIREFINGWAVYNRSGNAQTITLPQYTTAVSRSHRDSIHQLPDLDGEIYLKVGVSTDLNADGRVNILDLIIVSQAFGTTKGDVNGDGETNILDLTLVAQQFNQ